MSWTNPTTLLGNLKTAVEAIQIGGTPAFEEVRLYDSVQLDQAFSDLLIYKNRICLIVPGADSFEAKLDARTLIVKPKMRLLLLVADNDGATGQQAMFGGTGQSGVLVMKQAVLEALTGHELNLPPVCLVPETGDVLEIIPEAGGRSRKAWLLSFITDTAYFTPKRKSAQTFE